MSYMPKSKSDVHITPDRIFDMIKEYWGYEKSDIFDPCPLDPTFDGLDISWKDVNYVNPPYTLLSEFVQKALEERPKKTVMLLPAKTDQPWLHSFANRDELLEHVRKHLVKLGALPKRESQSFEKVVNK